MSGDPVERDTNRYIDQLGRWEMEVEDVKAEAYDCACTILRAYCDRVAPPADGSAPKDVGLGDDPVDQYVFHLWDSGRQDSVAERDAFALQLAECIADRFAESGGEGPLHWDW